tara:strand:+ start:2311 stop:3192 length:882 start_codon:yes stop_codon:yes gene_type:complete
MSKEDLITDQEIDQVVEDITVAELQNDEELVEDVEVDEEELVVEDAELEAEVVAYDFAEDLDALTAEEATLSEGFKGKAQIIFEAAIKSKIATEVDRLEENYAEQLVEEVDSIREDLTTKVDGYLSYVIETWMKDNELAVENGIRTEIAENFMTSLQACFTENYIEVPAGKEDMFDEMATKVDKLEEQLSEAVDSNIQLKKVTSDLQRDAKFAEISEGLTAVDVEKLKGLTKDIDFETVEQFEEKVATIKASYFKEATLEVMQDVVIEADVEVEDTDMSPMMARYVAAMKKTL